MKKLYFLLILFLLTPLANSQPGPGGAAAQQEAIQRRLQQQTQEKLRERDIEMRERSIANTQPGFDISPAAQSGGSGGGCLDVKYVHVSGVTKFKVKFIQDKIKSMINTCVNKDLLQDIQAKTQSIYIDKGYIGARVYFDFSEVNLKKLNIIVSEGILEDIILLDPQTKQPRGGTRAYLERQSAFPFTINRVLQLRDIEQGLEQINKLSSSNASMDVRPGKAEGSSIIIVDNQSLPKNTLTLSYDNSGAENTGTYRGSVTYSKDNLLSLNENIYINASSTLWNNKDLRYSKSLTGSITVPFGYWTVSDSVSFSKYLTTTSGAVADFESDGHSLNNTFSLERMLLRGADYKLGLGAQLTLKDSKNYIEDVFIKSSSRMLAVGSLYATGTYYSNSGSFFSKLAVNRGLDIFGAKKDTDLSAGDPKAQFTSLSLYLNYSTTFFSSLNYTASMDAQYGFDDMFGSEQMIAGGEGTVRGFKEHSAFGESGVVVRQDLRLPAAKILGQSKNAHLNKMINSLYFGVFADYGFAKPKTYGDSASLAGAGAKLSYYGKYISGAFTYSKAVYKPDFLPSEGDVFYFNIALNISF